MGGRRFVGARQHDPDPRVGPPGTKKKLPLEDQAQPPTRRRASGDRARYLRIGVHVEDDTLSVRDIKEVEGLLVANEDLHGAMAYEVTVSGERVASASIPDAGVNRSFPPL
jgi:hypothetical protein